ncbi:MAG: DUF5522 domain-containing protein [Weeksellaceae bacterium]|jgi:hypothetical protein|nr:DUF5522 domain-containing protein [Weeksellaceae bacterium]
MNPNKYKDGDYYKTEQGYIVFTEQYLLRRGFCCRSGCRHCPYGYDKNTDSFRKAKKNEPKK